jgi:hypothetical protein
MANNWTLLRSYGMTSDSVLCYVYWRPMRKYQERAVPLTSTTLNRRRKVVKARPFDMIRCILILYPRPMNTQPVDLRVVGGPGQ